ncbi:MAG: hypothetical protein ING84_06630 [Cytophagales bacterium]|jgi:hypothetical protein|nr:hypothetical protein [Cytophagales bacterium]MCA6369365.1 hypothetical protein [Cytophagales bacterium]MCA6373980.1 hypothetical protein [Cytophagales bacterium]MCA6376343.1 hypothetical protein [Cytophagales bacterium]MCA6385548.1 hypothetical protein [Cytophagales bacterium]
MFAWWNRVNVFDGMVVPFGLDFYTLPEKRFGLHIELGPFLLAISSLKTFFSLVGAFVIDSQSSNNSVSTF